MFFKKLKEKRDRDVRTNMVKDLTDYEINQYIRVAGTDYDRRRKFTQDDINSMIQMYNSNIKVSDIARAFCTSCTMVKYHVDHVFRTKMNKKRNEYEHNKQDKDYPHTAADRKRKLFIEGKLHFAGEENDR